MRIKKVEFDERQRIERGRAFQYAFFSMAAALLICGLTDSILKKPFFDYDAMLLIPVWTGITAFLITVIRRDAVERAKADGWNFLAVLWGVVGAAAFVFEVLSLVRSGIVADGVLSHDAVIAFDGACMMAVCAAYRMKRRKDRAAALSAEHEKD